MLVNCVVYQEGRKLADIAKGGISEYVRRPDCFVWVALHRANDAELAEMQEEFGLSRGSRLDDRHRRLRVLPAP